MCDDNQTSIDELAVDVCNSLGFTNFTQHKLVNIPTKTEIDTNEVHNKTLNINSEPIEVSPNCAAFFIECLPNQSNHSAFIPLHKAKVHKNQTKVHETEEDHKIHSFHAPEIVNHKPVILQPRHDLVNHLEDDFHEIPFPWNSEVYVDGKSACNGVLMNQNWVMVEKNCLKNAT